MAFRRGYGSHLPILMTLVEHTHGPILELGMGYFSTPYLHWTCFREKRRLISYENDLKAVKMNYRQFRHPAFHNVIWVENWDDAKIERHWTIALVDHAPAERRIVDVERLQWLAEYIVIHDSDPETDKHYSYSKIYPMFKYRYDYTEIAPHTTVLSNLRDLAWL